MKTSFLILIATHALLVGCASLREAPPSFEFRPEPLTGLPAANNVSPEFESRFAGEWKPDEIDGLRGYRVILVPGLMSDQLRRGPGGYFDGQNSYLLDLGIQSEIYEGLSSQAPITERARGLAETVEASDSPVLLIGHSKGGLEILEALLREPDAAKAVIGWSSIQTPFRGSPVADLLESGPLLDLASGNILKMLGGEPKALEELQSTYREAYRENSETEIYRLLQEKAHLFVSGWISDQMPSGPLRTFGWRAKHGLLFDRKTYSILKGNRDLMLAGHPNRHSDGLVPRTSAVLPGSQYVAIDGLDHRATIGSYCFSAWTDEERNRLVMAILQTLTR